MPDRARTGYEIAVVGMAGRFPGAPDLAAFWRNLRDGVESVRFFTPDELAAAGIPAALAANPAYVPARAVVDGAEDFDAGFFGYYDREAQLLDPQHRLFLECAWEALEDAGVDPARAGGDVGVFAGAGTSGYAAHLAASPEIAASADAFQVAFATGSDYLATRVSYKLDLTGPALTVQTACSTSLVAIHLACQSLLSGECDAALAGGVWIAAARAAGHLHVRGGALSPDGHCRPFDADAAGTFGGDGVGIVVLKRLEDALEAGDTVRAVLLGSAVNNDGGRKAGFTAPSVEGQVRVVRAAHAAAAVDPSTVTYVEAHGTATPLGDPIEVAALARAFRAGGARGTGFCAIGSVKSNLGHTDAAAGVAGVLKTVLAMQAGQIPPTLHFRAPNPEIGIGDTPFRVAGTLQPWTPAGGAPRRAGVSSFGVGGTNAHVVLEEAPAPEPADGAAADQLLVLSARTSAALGAASARLAAHLRARPDAVLADVASTLQRGRTEFPFRRALAVRSAAEAADALEAPSPAPAEAVERPVAFLFPGGGAQYPGMGAGLYAAEPAYRKTVDRCAEVLLPLLGLDIRHVLHPPADGMEGAREAMGRPPVLLAALFTVEYALASLWMARGVRPAALIGHSLGEYVAACVAGVLELDDALALVALRGGLLETVAPGAMLNVLLPEDELLPLLDDGLSLAAVNAPSLCAVSGPPEAVRALQDTLSARRVVARRIDAPRAGHSAAVEPILAAFQARVREFRLHPPRIPYVSGVTGTWITDAEATDPAFWARHLRQPVRFSDGVAALLAAGDHALVEVGPGAGLGALVRRCAGKKSSLAVFSSLAEPDSGTAESTFLLEQLGRLWAAGTPVDWDALHAGSRRRRVPLPTYPFERRRFWVDAPRAADRPLVPSVSVDASDLAAAGIAADGGLPEAVAAGDDAPRTPVERRLAALWGDLFGIDGVGREDDFFALGGHSLLATRLVLELRTVFGAELSLRDLAGARTVAALAARLEALGAAGGSAESTPSVASVDGASMDATDSVDAASVDADSVDAAAMDGDEADAPELAERLDPAIQGIGGVDGRAFAPRTVFLTGATGYLGAHLLRELLARTDADVLCLVRAADADEGRGRIRDALRRWRLWDERWAPRVVPVAGDLGRPLLGLPEARFDELAARADAVYHCGARVHFTLPYDALRPENVGGTEEVVRLAARGRPKPLHHVSTLAVFGAPHLAGTSVDEADAPPPCGPGAGAYARSKWAAERLVDEARRRGVPVSLYRAGAVTGDTRTGVTRTTDFVWSLVRGCVQLGAAPELDWEVPGAPADAVASMIVHLSLRPDALGGTYHLAPSALRWTDAVEALREMGYPLRVEPYARWTDRLAREAAPDGALYPFIALLREGPPASPRFGARAAAALLGEDAAGPALKDLFPRYVGSSRVDLQACKLEYSIVSPK